MKSPNGCLLPNKSSGVTHLPAPLFSLTHPTPKKRNNWSLCSAFVCVCQHNVAFQRLKAGKFVICFKETEHSGRLVVIGTPGLSPA